jgi:hypothetical protein
MTYQTREEWLHAFADAARPQFVAAGHPLPASIRIGVGWASGGARTRTIGECYYGVASTDGLRAIIITPGAGMADASRVADVLTHELAHAALPEGVGHRKPFADLVRKLGLDGPATATVAGDAWRAWAAPILETLGPYPHAALSAGVVTMPRKPGEGGAPGEEGEGGTGWTTGRKTQTTRMLKAACACGYTVRLTRKWLEAGAPRCGVCEGAPRMVCEGMEEGEREAA